MKVVLFTLCFGMTTAGIGQTFHDLKFDIFRLLSPGIHLSYERSTLDNGLEFGAGVGSWNITNPIVLNRNAIPSQGFRHPELSANIAWRKYLKPYDENRRATFYIGPQLSLDVLASGPREDYTEWHLENFGVEPVFQKVRNFSANFQGGVKAMLGDSRVILDGSFLSGFDLSGFLYSDIGFGFNLGLSLKLGYFISKVRP